MANPYQVAIQLALASNHEGVLRGLSQGLLGVIPYVNQLEGSFNKLKGVIAGAIGVGVGVEMFSMLGKLIDKTKDLSHEITQLRKLGLSEDEIARVQKEAIRITGAVPGTTETEALKIQGQTYSLLGLDNSIKVAESLAKFQSVIKNTTGKFDEDDQKQLYQMIRSADLLGKLTDPTTHQVDIGTLQKYLDIGSKVMLATHGRVTPQTWLGMAQQGGPALMNLDEQGLMTMGMMSQIMGGPRAGTAMMSLFQQMAGGQMPKRTAIGMEELGLLKPGEWKSGGGGGAGGGVILSDEASKRLSGLVQKDPLIFAETIKKMMEDKGITSNEDQIRSLFRILGRQTTQRFTADELRNLSQMEQERQRIGGATSIDEAMKLQNKGDVSQNIKNLEAAWTNFQLALAGPNAENTIAMLQKLTEAINAITGSVRGMDPETLKALGIGIAALAGAFIVGGASLMLAAIGTGGWLIVGLGALFGIFAAFKPDTLKEFIATLNGIEQAVIGWGQRLRAFFGFGAAPGIPATPGGAPGYVPGQPGSPGFLPPGNSLVPNRFGFVPDAGGPGPRTQGGSGSVPFIPKRMSYTPANQYGGYQNAIHTSGRSGGGVSQPIIVSLNIDGRKISEALSSSLAELMEFPNQAPYHDTYGGYTSNDSQFADT